jgi:molybdate transport system substrate-binding protein
MIVSTAVWRGRQVVLLVLSNVGFQAVEARNVRFGRFAAARRHGTDPTEDASERVMIKWIGALALILAVVGQAPAWAQAPGKGPVIFAAASMKTALDAIAAAWAAKGGKPVVISYASSAALAKQIESGAPADIFISADLKWMDYLGKAGLINVHTRQKIVGNDLVLIAPAQSTSTLKLVSGVDLAGAIGDGKLAVCTIESCPAGVYGKQSLEKLGIWTRVQPKLAQADNVRAALLLVARSEAKFGIVYGTDAKAEPLVKVIDTFPASTHDPIVYPIALTRDSKSPDAAAFEAFMRSMEATKILSGQGFAILK